LNFSRMRCATTATVSLAASMSEATAYNQMMLLISVAALLTWFRIV
jgi:hypothetical protein